jgi:hypothetical protein
VVGIVQRLERQIVVLDVVGSNPITHPTYIEVISCEIDSGFSLLNYWDVAKSVRHQTLTLAFRWFESSHPSHNGR